MPISNRSKGDFFNHINDCPCSLAFLGRPWEDSGENSRGLREHNQHTQPAPWRSISLRFLAPLAAFGVEGSNYMATAAGRTSGLDLIARARARLARSRDSRSSIADLLAFPHVLLIII
jgi:hypothetical protein